MIMKKNLIVAVLATFCVTFALFSVRPTRSANDPYDPWADLNDDGVINMRDIGYECSMFGTTGIPMNKTSWQTELQSNTHAIRFYTSNETYSDKFCAQYNMTTAAVFTWIPSNSTNNAILGIYCYTQMRGGGNSSDHLCYVRTYVDNVELGWSVINSVNETYIPSPIAGAASGVCYPNQSAYVVEVRICAGNQGDYVYVKDVNVILLVADGLNITP